MIYKHLMSALLPGVLAILFTAVPAIAPAQEGSATKPPASDHHAPGTKTFDLGTTTVGTFTIEAITQEGVIVPGSEGAFDILAAKDQTEPKAIRAWIGVESGKGSVKTILEKEPNRHYHSHVKVPKSLPTGSKYWIEVEAADSSKVSVGLNFRQK